MLPSTRIVLSASIRITLAILAALFIALLLLPTPAHAPTQAAPTAPTPDPPRGQARAAIGESAPRATAAPAPLYRAADFLRDYLTNSTYPRAIEGKAWINSSLNVAQARDQLGGTTFWDFWGETEEWGTTNHQWQDDAGAWHLYTKETIATRDGRAVPAYILVDRRGPGVMDLLYFVHETIIWRGDVLQHLKIIGNAGVEDVVEWGNLQKLGNLRIEVDDQIVYDGAIRDWFSGKAQNLTPNLAKILVWRYQDFGSTGNIVPIPYANRLKVSVYGGEKPKWFMATGVTLPPDTRVEPYGTLPIDDLSRLARNVLQPERYLDQYANIFQSELHAQADAPARIELNGAGTVEALQFRISKRDDPARLWLRVRYGDETAIDLPLVAFFSEHEQLSLHHSAPLGVIDAGDAYLFYSNLPMPYQNGLGIEITAASATPIAITARFAVSDARGTAQLRAQYNPATKLRALSPDYQVKLEGDGKLVGIVLVTKDQDFKNVVTRNLPNTNSEDPATHSWTLGYLEANLKLQDGAGNARVYNGHEDWAGGGYYFNLGFTTPSGGGNRPFGGILRYKDAEDGYATVFRFFSDLAAFRFKNGLTLSFGHGTWRNNYPVAFGSTVWYYSE